MEGRRGNAQIRVLNVASHRVQLGGTAWCAMGNNFSVFSHYLLFILFTPVHLSGLMDTVSSPGLLNCIVLK